MREEGGNAGDAGGAGGGTPDTGAGGDAGGGGGAGDDTQITPDGGLGGGGGEIDGFIGDGEGGNASVSPNSSNGSKGTEPEITDEVWLEGVKFTEEVGKDADGNALVVNQEVLKGIMPELRKLGLSSEQASGLVTAYAKLEQAKLAEAKAAEDAADAEWKAQFEATKEGMKAQVREQLSEEDIAYANRAMAKIKTENPDFYKSVRTSLLCVHPTFLKLCAQAARYAGDDGLPGVNGVGGDAQKKSPGELMFGKEIAEGLVKVR